MRGAGITLLISIIGTIVGLIGLAIGVFRTAPKSENQFIYGIQNLLGWILNVYIEIFRGTPMIVQSVVIYYGTAQKLSESTLTVHWLLSLSFLSTLGAYMTEIVRGGILAVDKGQFEAATALGMTHNQTMRKIVLPQVVRNILPATGNEFVINIKGYICIERYLCCRTLLLRKYSSNTNLPILPNLYHHRSYLLCPHLHSNAYPPLHRKTYGYGYLHNRC